MRAVALGLSMMASALGGCAEGLRFRTDERLHFTSPPARRLITGPLVLGWRVDPDDFRVVGADGSSDPRRGFFAVFVDRPPMRPGQPVGAVAESDPYCRPQVGCPDRDWLERHGVHLTGRSRLALRRLPRDGGQDLGDVRRHQVTVVLLDGRGVRIDESSWSLTLFTPKEKP